MFQSKIVKKCSNIFRNLSYNCIKYGNNISSSFKRYIINNEQVISPFHDIPLYHDKNTNIFNMIVEIPKFTNYKLEISKFNKMNPIMFDIKNGKVRTIHNVFPYHGYIWNYGCLPQTWENPYKTNNSTNYKGDNDPIDTIEIGSDILDSGTVVPVKILGVLGMIDQGEMDWKVVVINKHDPIFDRLNEITDVEQTMPGLLDATRCWFQYYKVPDGKAETQFSLDGKFQNKDFSLQLIHETHDDWKSLIDGNIKTDIDCSNVTISTSPYCINLDEANRLLEREDSFMDSATKIDGKWYFISP